MPDRLLRLPAAPRWWQIVWRGLPVRRLQLRRQGFRRLLDDPAGRELLADLADYCNARQASFVPGDPYATAFNEGQRDVFLHLLELAQLSDAQLLLLLEERTAP